MSQWIGSRQITSDMQPRQGSQLTDVFSARLSKRWRDIEQNIGDRDTCSGFHEDFAATTRLRLPNFSNESMMVSFGGGDAQFFFHFSGFKMHFSVW